MAEQNATYLGPYDTCSEAFVEQLISGTTALDVDSVSELPLMTLYVGDASDMFTGKVLGFGSSYRESHLNHNPGSAPPKGVRCSGCRWTDTFIVRVDTPGGYTEDMIREPAERQYVLISLGKSKIEGESMRQTVIWTADAAEVLRKLFVPTKPGFKHDTGGKAIPPHNGAAFREAARVDSAFSALLNQYGEAIPDPAERGADADPLAGL